MPTVDEQAWGRWRWWVTALALALSVVAGVRTFRTYSALKSDLEELLPGNAPSVAALAGARQRIPAVRHLGIVVDTGGPENLAQGLRFIDDLKARIEKYPADMVGAVMTDLSLERNFGETYALQLMDPKDVRGLREAVERRRDWEVSHAMGMDILDENEDPKPAIPVAELRNKYQERFGKPRSTAGNRFIAEDGRTLVALVRASSHSTGYEADAALLERVKKDAKELGFPDAYQSGMRIGYAGDVATRVEEMEGLAADLSVSGVIAIGLVLLSLRWFFKSWWSVVVLGVPLLIGTAYGFGVVALPPLSIQHLNSNTGFLGSVIVGNGINCGIILLARFLEERNRGKSVWVARADAVRATWRATLAASAAAATAYGSLIFTDFRGFNQFGWIGGAGMLTCWASMYTLVPILLDWTGHRFPVNQFGRTSLVAAPAARGFGSRIILAAVARPRLVLALTAVATLVAGAGLVSRGSDWLEHDLSRLRRRDSFVNGERYWGKRMDDTLQRYLTPTVILASTSDQATEIADRVQALMEQGKAGGLISAVRSARDVFPNSRFKAVEEARRLKLALTSRMTQELKPEDRRLVETALTDPALTPLRRDQIPVTLTVGLREPDGRLDRNVLVFPKLTGGTWDGQKIRAFTQDLRDAAQVDSSAQLAGSLPLSADITSAMEHDGPRATAFGLLAALVICALAFGSFRLSIWAMASLCVGVVVMMGALAWTGARLNFSNFVVLPITFGVSADYAINVLQRYKLEGRASLQSALANTGGAVGLCSATTIIGFGSLLAAQNQALFSFGVFAATGELATLVTATVSLPALLVLLENRRSQPMTGRPERSEACSTN